MKKLIFLILSIQLLFGTGTDELKSGDVINGSIVKKEKQYYKIVVPKNKSLRVRLRNLEADVDLYVKREEKPRIRFNDCYSSNSKRNNEDCILNNTEESAEYYILVNGFKTSTYVLNVDIEELEKIEVLTIGKRKGYVSKGDSYDYKLSAKKGETVKVKLSDLTGDADLRLKIGRKANRHTFDCKSNNGGTKEDICSVTLEEDATVYVNLDGYKTAKYSLELVYTPTRSFPESVLFDGLEKPEDGVYVKYTKDKKKAYIFVDQQSRYFDKHNGLTAIDNSDKNNPAITAHLPTNYQEPKYIFLTENENILTYTYINMRNGNEYLGTINLSTVEFADNTIITDADDVGKDSKAPFAYFYKGHMSKDLFYTVHGRLLTASYTYYHISSNGDISKISGIDSGTWDNAVSGAKQGPIGDDRYYITYIKRRGISEKKIYDVSNLPDMPLIDTIIIKD